MTTIRRIAAFGSNRMGWLVCVLGLWYPGSGSLLAADDLASRLQPLVTAFDGEVGLQVKHLVTGESYSYHADEPMPTASLIKLPIMIATYDAINAGRLSLEQRVTLHKEDKVPGSGILTPHFSDGTTLPLHDAIQLMIAFSDNTATNLVIDQVGLETTTDVMKSLGCENTCLHSKVFRRDTSIEPDRSRRFGLGSTTSEEMVKLLGLLQSEKLVSQGASQQMLAHLNACEDRSRIVRFLPAGTVVAHKSGSVSASRCDAGIVMSPAGPIAMCILTYKIEDRSWDDNNAADLFCANIAKSAYEYFNEGKPAESGPPILRVGANGLLVEALQRTLNERMVPSPGIGVDGDFGPQTEEAVKAFQRGNQLADTGEVGPETWAALGPLSSEAPVPDPEVLNSAKIEKAPEEDLQAPPLTTCHAWVIGDGETGEILWSLNPDEVRDIASTTKIMTGYLVANLAQQDTAILDEVVTFSARADETEGSSARVRTGEQLPVRELLYGLLLPSGNDASVALAEQFGPRLSSPPEGADKVDSYACFIAAMNAKAQELGMKNTSFRNPNGLPEEGHHSTAADLLKLSYAAMQLPLFREYVGTVQHGYAVTGPGGYQRNLQWNNTNRLLKIEGYQGIKTGTTNAAGACLVSQATRGDRTLLAVVLGATTSDGRYIDSRNLYRWAWQQLEQGNGPQ